MLHNAVNASDCNEYIFNVYNTSSTSLDRTRHVEHPIAAAESLRLKLASSLFSLFVDRDGTELKPRAAAAPERCCGVSQVVALEAANPWERFWSRCHLHCTPSRLECMSFSDLVRPVEW